MFVTAAYRLDHVDIYHADGFKLAGRIFIDGLPSHIAFDAESKTVFVTLQQSGRLAAFDLATQALKWNVPVGNAPAGVVMLPDDKRLLVALTGEDNIVVVDPKDGAVKSSLQTGKGAHNFWPKGDGRHYFLSNRVEGTVSPDRHQGRAEGRGYRPDPGRSGLHGHHAGRTELWVTQRFLRRVAIVDIETLKLVASIPVGKSPHGVFMLKSTATVAGAPVRAASTAGERR